MGRKRRIAIAMWVAMVLLCSACGSGSRQNTDAALTEPQSTEAASSIQQNDAAASLESAEPETEKASESGESSVHHEEKILVAYFSRTGENYSVGVIEKGNTHIIADMIAEQTGGDTFEIHTVTPYPDGYDECTEVARKEKDENARPELAGTVEGMDDYDIVFLGFPIWWGDMPMAVYTFLESYDFSGKTIVPFCTHEGSGLSSTENSIADACPDAEILEGLAIRGAVAQNSQDEAKETVSGWLEEIGFAGHSGMQAAGAEETITVNGGAEIPLSSLDYRTDSAEAPVVYFISDITPESLVRIYEALEWTPTGNVAVKMSTGEPPASNYLRPELVGSLVQKVDGTIVECNTAYGGSRAETAMHYQVAEDHGFTKIADVKIQDEDGSMSIPVAGGTRLSENFVGAAFADYDSYLVLSHFKGHAMAGFGGAIKNISIGLGSSEGKNWIHTGGTNRTTFMGGEQDWFLEAMGDAGKAVSDYLGNGERITYINVMNRLSIDCDCDGNPAEPDIHDIGILASNDPVALDQACIDLVSNAEGNESLMNRIASRNGIHTLENAETIGLGSRSYQFVNLDN